MSKGAIELTSSRLTGMSRTAGVCPVAIDWKFKTSSRHTRRLMIEEAYLAFERQQKEAEQWYAADNATFQEKLVATSKPEKKRRPPPR